MVRCKPSVVHSAPKIGEKITIRVQRFAAPTIFSAYGEDARHLASDSQAKCLSRWAFAHGANEVDHRYDLKLSDSEN